MFKGNPVINFGIKTHCVEKANEKLGSRYFHIRLYNCDRRTLLALANYASNRTEQKFISY